MSGAIDSDGVARRHDAVIDAMRAFAESTADYRRLLATVAERTAHVVGDGCVLVVLSDDGRSLVPAAVHFDDDVAMAAGQRLLAEAPVSIDGDTIGPRVLRTREDVHVPKLDDLLRTGRDIAPAFASMFASVGARALLSVPLQIDGRVIGVLSSVQCDEGRPFGADDRAVLRSLAAHAALAIANAQLLESLKREVHERKRAEEAAQRFVALIEHSSDFIAMATVEGRILFVNQAGRQLVGIEPDADVSQYKLRDFHSDDGMKRASLLREHGRWQGEGQLRNLKTGEWIDTSIHSFLVRAANGEPYGYATVQRDIRASKRIEAQLRELETRLLSQLDGHEEAQRVVRDSSRMSDAPDAVFGVAPTMRSVRELADIALHHSEPVLLLGSTGSGKGHLAQWIRDHGPRAKAPFVALNCSSLSGDLLQSELFGSAKGAFTSAVRDRRGLIEEADGGTLFLDEIGDMDPSSQTQLLKVIEEKRFRRVGETNERRSDFRLICATHRDLREEVKARRFREDLYYRINVFPITLPDLRERIEDLPSIARSILDSVGASHVVLRDEIIELLGRHPWPGNVRELRNTLIRAVLFARGGPITAEHFPGLHTSLPMSHRASMSAGRDSDAGGAPTRERLNELLARHRGNRSGVAKALGVSRTTLYRYLELRGIPKQGG